MFEEAIVVMGETIEDVDRQTKGTNKTIKKIN